MLPTELLAVWKRRGNIFPRYAKTDEDTLEVANILINAYRTNVGEKKQLLKKCVRQLEDEGHGYRFVRGLAILLDRRSTFKPKDKMNALDLRRRIFEATGVQGIATDSKKRKNIIKTVASELEVNPETVEEYLYADLDDELVLQEFHPPKAEELVTQYNLSLTQTLLFDSTELKFTVSGNWQTIFHAVKRLGLIYEAFKNGKVWVKIDGPASLFKLTRRYGTATAKLLPAIMAAKEWTIEAKILWRYTNEICNFKVDSWKHGTFLRNFSEPAINYDSKAEQNFAEAFQALKTKWQLKREPEPVSSGTQVIIPDFSLEKEGVKVYMEIVGFWTQEYLHRKIEKLKKTEANMLVAFDEELACEKIANLQNPNLNIIYYREKVPLAPVLRYLEQSSQGVQSRQEDFLKSFPVTFTEAILDYGEFASRIGVSVETVKKVLADKTPQGYKAMPNCMVRQDRLDQIRREIEQKLSTEGRLALVEALNIVESEGVTDGNKSLETLGYRIVWHGINAEKAEIVKH